MQPLKHRQSLAGSSFFKQQGSDFMRIFDRYADLLSWVERKGFQREVLGCAPDGAPVVCLRTGGEKSPAIFISAGSHSTEQAGVGSALGLLEELDTEHEVFVIPSRDPMGMNGYGYALSLSLGEEPEIESVEDVRAILKARGEVLYEKDETVLAIIGEYGYSTTGLLGRFEVGAEFLEPLFGRRIFYPSSDEGEGTAPCQRAYTLIVSPDGEVLHINRFHDSPWAPVESRCARDLMARIEPGLTLDLHEYGGDGFWFSARHQRNEDDELWEERMADSMIPGRCRLGCAACAAGVCTGSVLRNG